MARDDEQAGQTSEGWHTSRTVVRGGKEVTDTSWVYDEETRVVASLDHPLGFTFGVYERSLDHLVQTITAHVDEALAHVGEPLPWPSLERDLAIAAAAPAEVPHAELLHSLRNLIELHDWTRPEVRSLAITLRDTACITPDEADWLRTMAMPAE